MTEKKFRFLEQLEDDLRDAAARERVAGESKGPRHTSQTSRGGDGQWTRWLAAAVVVLVVAGGIGAFVQQRENRLSATKPGSGATGVGKASIGTAGSGDQKFIQHTVAGGEAFGAITNDTSNGELAPQAAASTIPGLTVNDLSGGGNSIGSAPLAQQDLSKIIRNGVVTVELPDGGFSAARDRVSGFAKDAGGYVVSSSARGSGSGTFVLRIPARKFDAVMGQLAHLPDGKVLWQNSTGQDVTAEFVDSGAELQILKAQKAATLRYLKNAGSLSQAIQFRNQAFQIQGEIDKLQGRLNYLANQVSLSTITVNLREKGAPASTRNQPPVTKPSLVRAWDRAVGGFLGVISAVIVGLGYVIPLGVLALLIGMPIMVLTRKRRATSSAS